MRFQILPIGAAMLAATQAAPTSEPETHPLVPRTNRCGHSTFENKASAASPLIRDCEQLSRNIAGGGMWTVGAGGHHRQLAQYGTCAFGIEGRGIAQVVEVGNEDIMDLIRSSIQLGFTHGGDRVGSSGEMPCQYFGGGHWQGTMRWGIYHD